MTTPAPPPPPPPEMDERRKQVEEILNSDIGVAALLQRLKQSITSTRDFSAFLKKRAGLEDDHVNGLRKLCRATHESLRRPDSRQHSYLTQFEEVTRAHEKLADNGSNFAVALHQMHDELIELAGNSERGRKQWKAFGTAAEKRVHDAETQVEKAKAKYEASSEEFERVKAGDRRSGSKISGSQRLKSGFTRLKSRAAGAPVEEDLQKRIAAADLDYNNKVQSAVVQRQELMQTARPQTITALREMILECDAGLCLQLQKYVQLTEKMLLSNGITISPYDDSGPPGLRQVVGAIDNDDDLCLYLLDYAAKSPMANHGVNKYTRHPSLSESQPPPPPPPKQEPHPQQQTLQQTLPNQFPVQIPQETSQPPAPKPEEQQHQEHHQQTFDQGPQSPQQHNHRARQQQSPVQHDAYQSPAPPSPPQHMHQQQPHPDHSSPTSPTGRGQYQPFPPQHSPAPHSPVTSPNSSHHPASFAHGPAQNHHQPPASSASPSPSYPQQPQHARTDSPSQGHYQPFPPTPTHHQQQSHSPMEPPGAAPFFPHQANFGPQQQPQHFPSPPPHAQHKAHERAVSQSTVSVVSDLAPPVRPVFGVPLEEVLIRDNSAVPVIVYQCLQAVDLFGLTAEGIYRISGDKKHVDRIKAAFDNDATAVNFQDPASFYNDIHSVATVLKLYLRSLPEPLLTHALHNDFIRAAQFEDEIQRRDSLHGLINQLPDANYATLRLLIMHLHRVQEHANVNLMNTGNLGICFGPTLMGREEGDANDGMREAGWMVKAVETVVAGCYSIFE